MKTRFLQIACSVFCLSVLTLGAGTKGASAAAANAWYTVSFMTQARQDFGSASGPCPAPELGANLPLCHRWAGQRIHQHRRILRSHHRYLGFHSLDVYLPRLLGNGRGSL